MTWIYTKRLIMILLLLILGPIVLFFATPVACSFACFEILKRPAQASLGIAILRIFLCILLFFIGLASNVVVVPLGLILGIPFLIGFHLYQRYETTRNAKQRLKDRMIEA